MHLIDLTQGFLGSAPIVAGTVALAVGAALGSVIKNESKVTVSFFGDGAVGEGVVHEAMNFASLKKLPIIFACENNFYATHMPINRCRVITEIHRIAEPYNIPSFRIDGNNVLEVYRHAKHAVEKCREGNGPIFFELLTYRQHGHVGPDDNILGMHIDIRSKKEKDAWLKKDPIIILEKYLLENGDMSDHEIDKLKASIENEVEDAYRNAIENETPNAKEVLNYVFK